MLPGLIAGTHEPESASVDRRAWTSSLIVGLTFTVAALWFGFYATTHILGRSSWYVPLDLMMLSRGGEFVWGGHINTIYHSSPVLYSLPLSVFEMAPLPGVAHLLHITAGDGRGYVLLADIYLTSFGIFLAWAVRRLAWDLGARSGLWVLQAVAMVIVMAPEFSYGHLEDVLALTFTILAVRALLGSDHVRAALWLSVAISSKQWALLLVPLFVLLAPPGRRLRTLVAACALPAALAIYYLGVDWVTASKAFFSPTTLVRNGIGHPWFDGTWLGSRSSQVNRTVATLLAIVVAYPLRRVKTPGAVIAAIAGILLIRPLTETINFSYYWSPGLLLAAMVGVAVHQRVRWQDWIWPLAAAIWTFPRGDDATKSLWWTGEILLLTLAAVQVYRNLRHSRSALEGRHARVVVEGREDLAVVV